MTLALYGKSRRRQGTLIMLALFAVFAAMIGGVSLQKDASAESFTLSTTNGTFTSVSGGACIAGLNTNEVRWGRTGEGCPQTSSQSGYRWDGIGSSASFTDGQTAYLGRFTHFNQPISGGTSISGATLGITLAFTAPGAANAPITLTFAHEETSNGGDYDDCQYQIPPDSTPCPDRVVPTVPPGTVFTVNAVQYTLQLVAFERNATQACPPLPTAETFTPAFVTAEGVANYGCLYGKIVVAKPDLSVVKTSRAVASQVEVNTVDSGTQFRWEFVVSNNGATAVNWAPGDVVLRDNLPAGANYALGTQPAGYACTLSSASGPSTFECTKTGSAANQNAGSSLTFNVLATPTLTVAGPLANPAAGGICMVDPVNSEEELNETNNTCSDTISVTVPQLPDLTVMKVARKGGLDTDLVNLADPVFQWVFTIRNMGTTNATFTGDQNVLLDHLPTSPAVSYGATPTTSNNDVDCVISSAVLDCDVDPGDSFTFQANGANSLTVTVTVTPSAAGTLENPRPGADFVCRVDPDNRISNESNETNNDCTDTVTVTAAATIVVHKEEAGSLVNTTRTWDFRLSGGPTSRPDIDITDAGQDSWSVAPGTYTVQELDSGSVTTCGSVDGSYRTFHGDATNPATPGQTMTGITVAAGETKHVYFKNESCPGTVTISKSSSPQTTVAAGGQATWTVTIVIDVNPTTAAATISDTLPPGWTIRSPGISDDDGDISCTGPVGATSFSCTLQNNAGINTINVTVPVTAPANFPQSNCTEYTNTVTLTGAGLPVPISAEDKITVTNCINPTLTLSKSSSGVPSPLASGGTFNWVLTAVVSNGPTVANATITDTLPAGFTVNGAITDLAAGGGDAAKMSCTANAAVPGATGFTCTLLSTAPNGTYTITVPVKAPTVTSSAQCGQHTNTATAAFANVGGVPGGTVVQTNNSNTVTVTCPALSIEKSAVSGSVVVGADVQFDLVVTNTSTVPATGISVSDTLPNPAGLVWNATPALTFTPNTPVGSCAIAGNQLTCSGISLAAGANVRIRMTATTSTAVTRAVCDAHVNNNATATVLGNTVTSGSATVTVNCPAVTISKAPSGASTVVAGSPIGFVFTIQNTTSYAANGNVSVSDLLPTPSGVAWAQGAAAETSTTGSCSVTGATLTCTGLSVPANSSITVTVSGTTTAGGANGTCGLIENTGAKVTLLGQDVLQVLPAQITVQCPDASVLKTTQQTAVDAGDTITYTITVSAGPNGPSSNVVLTDTLQAGMAWSVTGDTTGCNQTAFPAGSPPDLSCNFGTMNAGTSKVLTLTATTTAAQCTPNVDNTATVSSTVDVNPNNNTSSPAEVDVRCPNVALTKTTSTPGPLDAGDDVIFTITATNTGDGAARDFILVDTLPSTVTGWEITANAPLNSCEITGGNNLRCPQGAGDTEIPAGGSISVTVKGKTTPASCTQISNTATATASNHPNMTSLAVVVDVRCPDVTVVKESNSPVNAGDTVEFTITVDNQGQGTAKNVKLSDTLSVGTNWTLVPSPVTGCTLDPVGTNPQKLACEWASIAPADQPITFKLTHPTSGLNCTSVPNTVTITADNETTAAAANKNSSQTSVSINCADIKIKKVSEASPVSATDPIAFVVKIWNEGPGEARGVHVEDTLPTNAGLNWTEFPDNLNCKIESGKLICDFTSLPANGTEATAVSVRITSPTTVGTCATAVNNVNATVTTTNDGTASDGEIILVNCPDVTVSKQLLGPNPVSAGDTISFKIVVTVTGAAGTVAKNVMVNEILPATSSQWSVQSADADCSTLVTTLVCDLGDVTVPGSGSKTFEITITGKAIGPNGETTCDANITNTVTVSAGNESNTTNNEAQAPVGVNCPKIEVTKQATDTTVTAGEEVRFKIRVTNNGGGTATNVMVRDPLPAGLVWSDNHANCQVLDVGTPAVPTLTCSGGAFASLASKAYIDIEVWATTKLDVCTELKNTAFASAGNDGDDPEAQSLEVTVDLDCADVTISKVVPKGSETIDIGGTATYVLKVQSKGPGDALGVVVTDELPDLDGDPWQESESACKIETNGAGIQVLTCEFAKLAAGTESEELTVTALVTADHCGPMVNTAMVSATNEDPAKKGDNESAPPATIFVNCPDLEVAKTGADINYGETASFTITVKNSGVGVAKDVEIKDVLPLYGEWTFAETPDNTDCSISGSTISCTTLDAGETVTVTVTSNDPVDTCEPITNSVSALASNEVDPDEFKNNDEDTIDVTCGTITIVKIDNVFATNPTAPPAVGGFWNFDVTEASDGLFSKQKIARDPLGGDSVTIQKVPFGTYSVVELEDQGIDVCPVPNPVATFSTVGPAGSQVIDADNTARTFTFTNTECGFVASTGTLEIFKVADLNANHVQDGSETKVAGWPITIQGPQFPGGTTIPTDSDGKIILPGIETGVYTVTEGSNPGFKLVGVVANDNAPVFTATNSASVDLDYSDIDTITFYNQPVGTITVNKATWDRVNNISTPRPQDRAGWRITVRSVACNVNLVALTNANGNATFPDLPACNDYVVAEDLSLPPFVGYIPVGSASAGGITPSATVNFVNERVSFVTPVCIVNCGVTEIPTATPTSPPPTNTPVPTSTQPLPSTPTPVSTQLGERTPGPASPTPIAPSTGQGAFGGPVSGTNLLLVLMGIGAVAGGLFVVGLGRRQRSSRR